ncbi:MAG: cupin domain-containing protein [Prevotella sp.]|jgi:quercetin dioxygenase-like cupin family protein|nr:cupin domain-containing protein [Prevotella sp.]
MKEETFITPPEHINFLAKKLFGNCGEIIDGSIAYLEVHGGGPLKPHTHEHSHLFIVVSGQARIEMGEESKILNANESFLLNGNIPHSVWNNADTTTIMVGLSVKEYNT